jgi:hypothetical protein
VGVVIAIGGAYTPAGTAGPFPVDGIIPFLKPAYDFSWAIGLLVAFLLYGGLTLIIGRGQIEICPPRRHSQRRRLPDGGARTCNHQIRSVFSDRLASYWLESQNPENDDKLRRSSFYPVMSVDCSSH